MRMRNKCRCLRNYLGDEGQGLQNQAVAEDHLRQTTRVLQKVSGFQTNNIIGATVAARCCSSFPFSLYRTRGRMHWMSFRKPSRTQRSGFSVFSHHCFFVGVYVRAVSISILKDFRSPKKVLHRKGIVVLFTLIDVVRLAFHQIRYQRRWQYVCSIAKSWFEFQFQFQFGPKPSICN